VTRGDQARRHVGVALQGVHSPPVRARLDDPGRRPASAKNPDGSAPRIHGGTDTIAVAGTSPVPGTEACHCPGFRA
jgi:hypothetical protein